MFLTVLSTVLVAYLLYYVIIALMEYFAVKGRQTQDSKEEEVDITDIVESFKSVEIDNNYLSKNPKRNKKEPEDSITAGHGLLPDEFVDKIAAAYDNCADKDDIVEAVENMLNCWAYAEEAA